MMMTMAMIIVMVVVMAMMMGPLTMATIYNNDPGDNDGDGGYGDVVLPGRSQPPLS